MSESAVGAALRFSLPAAAAASLLVGGTPLSLGADRLRRSRIRTHPACSARSCGSLRLPRVCIAATVGASLALCGAMLQGMLRNPLVDPYLTGVSAAAAAAIAIAILAGVVGRRNARRSASSPDSAPRCSSRRWRAAAAESMPTA